MIPSDFSVEGYYHSALEACSQASQLETQDRLADALTEYRRSIALIETMRQLFSDNDHGLDQAYFSGVDDVEGICRIHIAKLEGELPMIGTPAQGLHLVRRNSSDSVNTTSQRMKPAHMVKGDVNHFGLACPCLLTTAARGV